MKKTLVVLLAMLCAACAPAVTKVNIPDIDKSDAVAVSDLRPASEKDHKIFSLLITSKQYGIWRVGDGQLSPSPVRLLQYEIAKQPSDAHASPKVAVYHFVVYSNMQSQLRHGAVGAGVAGMAGALIGNAMAGRDELEQSSLVDRKVFDSLSGDEYKRGLYTPAEDPEKGSVYIVYIDTDIDGKRVFTRTIAPASPRHDDQNALTHAVQFAIKNQLTAYSASEAGAHT